MLLKPISVNIFGIFLSLMDDPRGTTEEEALFTRFYRAN